jgi:hypothetical protein
VAQVKKPVGGVKNSVNEGRKTAWLVARFLAGFAAIWLIFYGAFRTFPYLTSGAEVIYSSKLRQEMSGHIFPANSHTRRVMIFGDSRILAGFVPSLFDSLAAADGMSVSSYNSGYPGRSEFVSQLKQMARNKSNLPDVILLTTPWKSTVKGFDPFHPISDDYEIAGQIFPFRDLPRDTFTFFSASREHGGVRNYYQEARMEDAKMLQDRGYYFIHARNHFTNFGLPNDFHLDSDQPGQVAVRTADPSSSELSELNAIIREHHIQCYFVPYYEREGRFAAAQEVDHPFADFLQRYTSCKLLGPDYYRYPNHVFADSVHLNREGATLYTEAVYRLLANKIMER